MTPHPLLIICAVIAVVVLLWIALLLTVFVAADPLFDELFEYVLSLPAGS